MMIGQAGHDALGMPSHHELIAWEVMSDLDHLTDGYMQSVLLSFGAGLNEIRAAHRWAAAQIRNLEDKHMHSKTKWSEKDRMKPRLDPGVCDAVLLAEALHWSLC